MRLEYLVFDQRPGQEIRHPDKSFLWTELEGWLAFMNEMHRWELVSVVNSDRMWHFMFKREQIEGAE